MRIIIELDADSTTPELQITTQGKKQNQGADTTSPATTAATGKTTDAGSPKYMSTGQAATQPADVMPVSNMPEGSVNGTSAGAAPGDEG